MKKRRKQKHSENLWLLKQGNQFCAISSEKCVKKKTTQEKGHSCEIFKFKIYYLISRNCNMINVIN